jgi:hypothetical protein
MSEGNEYHSIEPHCFLPVDTRNALWAARLMVRGYPKEFRPAMTWLNDVYSELATNQRYMRKLRTKTRFSLRDLAGNDPCHAVPRRLILRDKNPRADGKTAREYLTETTIWTADIRGWRIQEGRVVTPNRQDNNKRYDPVAAEHMEIVWRWRDEKCRETIRHLRAEYRMQAEEIAKELNGHYGRFQSINRFLAAVRKVVNTGLPAEDCIGCAYRVVLLAAIIADRVSLPLEGEFAALPWKSEGNELGIGPRGETKPYRPGREVLFEQYGKDKDGLPKWAIAGSEADTFGNLVARALNILNTSVKRVTLNWAELLREAQPAPNTDWATTEETNLLMAIEAHIRTNPALYVGGAHYLADHYSAEWARRTDEDARRSRGEPYARSTATTEAVEKHMDSRRMFLAIQDIEATTDIGRCAAVLLLAVMAWDKDADKKDTSLAVFGGWDKRMFAVIALRG